MSDFQRNGRHHLGVRQIGMQLSVGGHFRSRGDGWGGHDDNPNRQTAHRVKDLLQNPVQPTNQTVLRLTTHAARRAADSPVEAWPARQGPV